MVGGVEYIVRDWGEGGKRKNMGQFLAIGLSTKIGVKKSEADNAHMNIVQVQENMQHALHFQPEIYTPYEQDNWYYFLLKEEVFQAQLLPLLRALYPLLYTDAVDYTNVLQELEALPPSEWLQWAKRKPEEEFQYDECGMWDYLESNHQTLHVYYEHLLLSMEGKIRMEVFGRQFTFLKYTMMQTFKQFSLAGALRMYITG